MLIFLADIITEPIAPNALGVLQDRALPAILGLVSIVVLWSIAMGVSVALVRAPIVQRLAVFGGCLAIALAAFAGLFLRLTYGG